MENDEVKFTQIKKRKYYPTWQHKNRKNGLASFIYCNPNGEYHWVISCFIKRCGKQVCVRGRENCNRSIYYNSLDKGLVYSSFEECAEAVDYWYQDREY